MFKDIMNIDWNKFKTMFPSYKKHKTMMWSEVLKTDELFRLRIVIPGYNKEDFELYEDNGTIRLLLNKDRGVVKILLHIFFLMRTIQINMILITYLPGIKMVF